MAHRAGGVTDVITEVLGGLSHVTQGLYDVAVLVPELVDELPYAHSNDPTDDGRSSNEQHATPDRGGQDHHGDHCPDDECRRVAGRSLLPTGALLVVVPDPLHRKANPDNRDILQESAAEANGLAQAPEDALAHPSRLHRQLLGVLPSQLRRLASTPQLPGRGRADCGIGGGHVLAELTGLPAASWASRSASATATAGAVSRPWARLSCWSSRTGR